MEAMKNIIAEFTVTIPKTAKTLAKFVAKDNLRPLLQYVVIMPGKGIATATDAHILQTVAIDARGEFAPDTIAYIDAKTFAKLAGHEITVSLTEEEREVIEVKTYRQFGQAHRQEYKVRRVFTVTHIYCGKTKYEVEVEAQGRFPDVQRAIPRDENMKRIELTDDGLAGLKSLCKVAKCNYILLSVAEGSEYVTVCAEAEQYENRRQGAILPLAHRAESPANIAFCQQLLAATLDGCNGAIGIDDYSRPAKVYGDAEATIIMPVLYNDDTAAYADELTRELPADTAFSDDAAEAVRQLQGAALGYWEYITECLKDIPAGNYTASEVCNRKKLGIYIDYPMSEEFEQPLAVKAGNIHIMVPYREIFDVLAKWEKLAKVKTIFTAGSVDEITAPVLAPNKEGNLSGKKMKLHKIGDGWYSVARRKTGYQSPIYREVNGHIIFIREMPNSTIDNPEDFAKWADDKAEQIPSLIMKQAKESEYFAALAKCIGLEETAIAATPTETPQISTGTAKTVNVSAEGEKEAERPQYRVWRFAKPNYAQIIVSDYSQWKVVAVLSFVWGKTQIEVSDDVANIHTIGKKELTIDKPLTELTDAEVLELIYNHTEPPQSPETPQSIKRTTDTPKPRETARKPQNRGIGCKRATRRDTLRDTLHPVTYVPRKCSTIEERERVNPQTLVVGRKRLSVSSDFQCIL